MDEEFRKLNAAALPASLDALDDRVLAGLAARKAETAATRRLMMVAGSVFVPNAVAASPLTPLIPASPLAPSTLLDAR